MNSKHESAAARAGFVAWDFLDGTPCCGKVIDPQNVPGFDRAYIERIDGTRCYVQRSKLRPASDADFDASMAFFTRKA